MLATPLEAADYTRLSTPEEMAGYLAHLAARTPGAELWPLGHSAGGRALTALRVPARDARVPPLRVLLVGSQHGASEAAGGEALLWLARELTALAADDVRASLEFVIFPDANPDGRALDSARNADEVNINRDFVLLTQPESRALDTLLREFTPEVVLDAHESASLKQKSLAREGYMTAFETQFDCANNPGIPAALRRYAEHELLPVLLARVAAAGVAAQRYVREILSLSQVATHGGLGARKFRNRAGLSGALAFLLETPMDPKHGRYPSYRNIAVRVARQLQAQRVFIATVAERRVAVQRLLAAHRMSVEPLILSACYGERAPGALLHLPMRRIADGEVQTLAFADHRRVVDGAAIPLPASYWVTAHQAGMARLLEQHGFPYEVLRAAAVRHGRVAGQSPGGEPRTMTVPAGSLHVPVRGPRARLLALLLEAGSSSSVFGYPTFARLLSAAGEGFVLADVAQMPSGLGDSRWLEA
ncbi:MAG: hypothetical protein IT492_20680 [Gammaproteobacteria bacterium]|nr:hypothetical protein [Gammaproteobacteria bacterium]